MNIQPSNLSASGTSFHGDTIRTTLNSIRKAFPDAIDDGGDGGYKCHHRFIFEMDNGEVVTLYDWKEGPISNDTVIDWHIGGHSAEATAMAKRVLESLIICVI